ncbi:MAG: SAP domain-containing protein [Rhodoglobus sp.]|nr:SAP domain-containing protein [Rhodoglobus sp.]
MATIISPRGNQFTIPDDSLQSYLDQGYRDASAPPTDTRLYSQMKVAELRDLLEARGLDIDGKKGDLVAALEADDLAEAEPVEDDEE